MIRRRALLGSAVAPLAAALAIAGCGGGGGGTPAGSAKPPTVSGGAATVGTASSKLGTILVDSQGRSLYLFQKDTGNKSTCTGACAGIWPPLRSSGKPSAGKGVNASLLGTTARSDGKPEVTYNGHPLYTYVGDQTAGDTNGQGLNQFGAGWFVVSPAGNSIAGTSSGGSGIRGY